MKDEMKTGEVYICKACIVSHAVIIHKVYDDGSFSYQDTSSMNTHVQSSPMIYPGENQEQFLKNHELATPERLEGLIAGLTEGAEVISDKLGLLKRYCEKIIVQRANETMERTKG